MSKMILLADDSVTIQKVVELTFMDGDYEIDAASNGDDALARLRERTPDFVIADVHMPGANGYEVCREVKASHPGVPVLLLVGTFEPFDPEELAASGADGHLKKPFDSQELLRLVEELSSAAPASVDAVNEPAEPLEPSFDESVPMPPVVEPLPAFGALSSPSFDEEPADVSNETAEFTPSPELAAPAFDIADEAPVMEMPEEPIFPLPTSEPEPESSQLFEAAPDPEPIAMDTPPPAADEEPAEEAAAPSSGAAMSDEDVERIARRVAELVGDSMLREVAWEVVPDMAEVVVRERLRELERQVEES